MRRTPPLKLGLIPLALYLVLAGGAAFMVPSDYGTDPRPTPPDEGAHLGYIASLVQQARLPVFRSQNDNYESHQPPLYYISCLPAYLIARAVFPGATADLARPGIVVLRLWSVLLSAISIWVAWLLGRRFFGAHGLLALAPALLLALWPGRTMIVSAVTNDALADSLCLLTFYLCIVVLAEGVTPRRVLLIGVAWALALMTKSTSLALGPVVVLALVMRAVSDERDDQAAALKQAMRWLALVAVPVVALAGWWFVRNQVLYGDPLAAKVFQELFTKDRATPDYFFKLGLSGGAYFALVVVNTALSFWGVFGQANVYQPQWFYLAGFVVWVGAVMGLVVQKAREVRSGGTPDTLVGQPGPTRVSGVPERKSPTRVSGLPERKSPTGVSGVPKREKLASGHGLGHGRKTDHATLGRGEVVADAEPVEWQRQGFVLAWVLLALVIAFFLRFNTEFYQAQARYLFAASGPIVLLLTLGLWDLDRRRYGLWALGAAILIMLVMSLISAFGFVSVAAAHNPPPFFGG